MGTTHLQCDRCLAITHTDDGKSWANVVVNVYPSVPAFRDLCPDCTHDLREWFADAPVVHENPIEDRPEEEE